MGVPGFYKELIKLFPFIVKDQIRHRVDYLYIDCNCLLHPQCFKILGLHPDETDQNKLFELMCVRILAFLDYLESLVKPAVLMYIAIDGIAPLAKMSQQRLRRMYEDNYKSILMRKHNIKHNSSWSNIVITPGTEFMHKLHNRIRMHYDKKSKVSKRLTYAYSSYMTPGEGEHKILQHIKKHIKIGAPIVIYGLDADLIFLAMSSQYPNIHLLREADQINQDKADENPSNVAELMLYLDIDATKHAINLQFNGELDKFAQINDDPFAVQTDKKDIDIAHRFDFINDYIFICYFLGNDFLPHLPSIDIKINGMTSVIDAYISVVQKKADTMIKIINNKVHIDAVFLYEFIKLLADQEGYYFQSILPDHMNRMRNRRCYETEKYKIDVWYVENLFSTLDKKGNLSKLRLKDPIRLGQSDWKYRYYEHYFHTDYRQQEMIDRICENYVDGLYWVAKYYFEECPTWRWQYKYPNAPFLSDLAAYLQKIVKPNTHRSTGSTSSSNIIEFNVGFDVEFDFEPQVDMYTQLVSVIPQRHSHILPSNLRCLSSSADSEVIDMYPITYPLDMAGKTILYKCLPHVPYLDIERVEKAIQHAVHQTPYTKAEIERSADIRDVVWK